MRTRRARFLIPQIILLSGGCGLLGAPERAEVEHPIPVVVATAAIETLHPSTEVIGQFVAIPERSATVFAPQPGVIGSVSVVEGQLVKSGQVIAELDARIATAERDKAQASLDAAKANVSQFTTGYRAEEVDAARDELNQAVADVAAKRAKLEALEPLLERGELPPVRRQQAVSDLQAAQANADAARSRLKLLEAGFRAEAVEEAQARMREAQAELELRQLAVDLCRIESPIEGTVTDLPIRLGSALDTQSMLANIIDSTELFAKVRLPASDVVKLDTTHLAEIRLTGLGGQSVGATIERSAHLADPQTGDTDVFLRVANHDGQLRPGQACQVRIWFAPVEDALAVPVAALSDAGDSSAVTVIRDRKAYEIPVTPGIRTQDKVQILAGLAAGDLVAVQNGYGLPDGFPVDPTP